MFRPATSEVRSKRFRTTTCVVARSYSAATLLTLAQQDRKDLRTVSATRTCYTSATLPQKHGNISRHFADLSNVDSTI